MEKHPNRPIQSLVLLLGFLSAVLSAADLSQTAIGRLSLPSHSALPPQSDVTEQKHLPNLGIQKWEELVRGFYPTAVVDPGLTEHGAETLRRTFIDYVGPANPVPSKESSAVVIGTVTDARAVLAAHQTAVYTAYAFDVQTSIGKSDLIGGSRRLSLTALQLGGTLRFPSGHVRHFIINDVGFLSRGGQYLLFLRSTDALSATYQILVAYLISGSQVFPLSDEPPFSALEGMSLQTLLDQVGKQ